MKKYKKLTAMVTPMTFFNLRLLAAEAKFDNVGQVIDKLTREHMLSRNTKILNKYTKKGEQHE